MIAALDSKVVLITAPQAILDDASWTTASIDTKGFRYLRVTILIGFLDIAMAALKLQTSDTDGSYSDLAGADFDGDVMSDGNVAVLPTALEDNTFWVINVDLRGKKRFFDLVATGGDGATGTFLTAWAELSRPEQSPNTLTERGALGEFIL